MEKKEVKLCTTQDSLQAEMILEALKNNGIPAYKKDLGYAAIMNIYGGYSNGGEEIYVAPENQEKAREVLAGMGSLQE